MPGAQLSRRHFSIRARESHRKVQEGSKKMVNNCWIDIVNPKLIPIKITFFLLMGATQCVAPYTTLLKKALGLTLEETALVFTIGSLVPIFAPFLGGLITDRIGNFRTFLVISVALSGAFALITTLIPPARTKIEQEKDSGVPFSLTCGKEHFIISYTVEAACQIPNSEVNFDRFNISDCGYKCNPLLVQIENDQESLKNKTIQLFVNDTIFVSCRLGDASVDQKCFIKNVTHDMEYNLQTLHAEFSLKNVKIEYPSVKVFKDGSFQRLTLSLEKYLIDKKDFDVFHCQYGAHSLDISLLPIKILNKNLIPEYIEKPDTSKCTFHCQGTMPKNKTCNQTILSTLEVHDVPLSIGLFVFSSTLDKFMIGLTYTMFEAGVVSITKEYRYDYGIQRIYGSIGGMVFAPVTGLLIDYFGTGSYTDYYVAYYMYCAVKLICALILTKLDLRFKTPAKRICGSISDVFMSIESVLLVVIVFFSGTCYGFIENFLPWHLNNLGADNWMIGLMTTIASCAALPFLAISDPVCRKFGHVQAISFGLICYSIRCLGYSMIQNPLWCYPFEVLEGITTGLLVAAAIIYGSKLSSQSNVGTLQGILATAHYGLGKGAGSSLGGYVMAKLTAKIAFRLFSGMAFVVAFSYYLIFKLVLVPRIESKRAQVCDMHVEVVTSHNILENFHELETKCSSSQIQMTSTPIKRHEEN